MALLRGKNALAQKPKVPLCPKDLLRMLCGARITRANSCWGIKDAAIRLPPSSVTDLLTLSQVVIALLRCSFLSQCSRFCTSRTWPSEWDLGKTERAY